LATISALLAARLRPPVASRIAPSRKGVTALPATPSGPGEGLQLSIHGCLMQEGPAGKFRFSIRRLMALILGLAPVFGLARIDIFLGMMAAAYGGVLAILVVKGWRANGIGWPLSVTCFVTVLLIAAWSIVRDTALVAGLRLTMPELGRRPEWPFPITAQQYPHIKRLAGWEAWSLFRWWLLFGGVTRLLVAGRAGGMGGAGGPATRRGGQQEDGEGSRSSAEASKRLLWFFPWLIVMELGQLGGVWLLFGGFGIIPEPSTMFAAWDPGSGSLGLPLTIFVTLTVFVYWVGRSTIPTLVVGTAFFRGVGRWSWRRAFVGALRLIPAAALLSSIWSALYLSLVHFRIAP